jgi:hypothetical protein
MLNKKITIRLIAMFAFILVIVLSINGEVSSAHGSSSEKKQQAGQQFSASSRAQDWSGLAQGTSYSGYTEITDNEEKIKVQVPVEWSDIETGAWTFKGRNVGVFVAASGDLGNFYSTRSQSGILIGVSRALAQSYNKDGLLGLEKRDFSGKCRYKGRFDYKNMFYTGQYDHFTDCATGVPNLLVFTTASADQKSLILIRIVVVSQSDLEAVDKIINTFQVLGDPERDEHHEN